MAFVSKTLLVLLGLALLSCALGNDERIVGGTIAKKKFRKFLSQLYIGGSFGCTGSILSDQYILTAAHCFDGISGRPNLVRRSFLYVGQRSADPDSSVPYYDFETVYMHKDYDESDKALRNDVAIVKIKQTLPSGSVHKVKLVSGPRPNKVVTVAGYGALNEDGTSASYAMQTKVVTKGFQECRNADRASFRNVLFKKYHVCAVSLGYPNEGRTDSCYGDSGGPIFRSKGKQFGITSFSTSGCAEPGGIPWYARVSSYKNDIETVVATGSSDAFVEYS